MVTTAASSKEQRRHTGLLLWLLPLGLLLLLLPLPAAGNPDAKRLYDDLLSNYNRLIRPVANNTDKITVKMGLKLSQLVDLVRLGK
jgi:hypothetical protein